MNTFYKISENTARNSKTGIEITVFCAMVYILIEDRQVLIKYVPYHEDRERIEKRALALVAWWNKLPFLEQYNHLIATGARTAAKSLCLSTKTEICHE